MEDTVAVAVAVDAVASRHAADTVAVMLQEVAAILHTKV